MFWVQRPGCQLCRHRWLFFRRKLKCKGTLNARWFFWVTKLTDSVECSPKTWKTPADSRPSHGLNAESFSEETAALVQRRRMPKQRRNGSSAGARTRQPELRWMAQQLSKAQMLDVTIISINQTRSACFLSFAVLTTMITVSCTFTLLQDVVSSGSDGFGDFYFLFMFFFFCQDSAGLTCLPGWFHFASFFLTPLTICRIIPKLLDKNV